MKKIEIFTGNRAEFGILLPLIHKLSEIFEIHLLISGAHLLSEWQTVSEIEEKLSDIDNVKVVKLEMKAGGKSKYDYTLNFSDISRSYIEYKDQNRENIEFCLFLGDRIETYAYAISAFYLENILIHIAGGDIANVSTFDSAVKHSITKISHLHLVTNRQSYNVVKQMGEQEWRISDIGMPSLDTINKRYLIPKEELQQKYNLTSDRLIIITYHPDHYFTAEESLSNFRRIIDGVSDCKHQTIITYPNNDPGSELLINEIENSASRCECIQVHKNLGTINYLSLLNSMEVIMIGNSSGIVTESAFFKTPGLLIGERQKDRVRGNNITELLNFTSEEIHNFVDNTFSNYKNLVESYKETQYIYGDGKASQKATDFIVEVLHTKSYEEIISKKFEIL